MGIHSLGVQFESGGKTMNELQKSAKELVQYYNNADGIDWDRLDNLIRNLGITLAVDIMNEGEDNENA
jgi:hypothetical protein